MLALVPDAQSDDAVTTRSTHSPVGTFVGVGCELGANVGWALMLGTNVGFKEIDGRRVGKEVVGSSVGNGVGDALSVGV